MWAPRADSGGRPQPPEVESRPPQGVMPPTDLNGVLTENDDQEQDGEPDQVIQGRHHGLLLDVELQVPQPDLVGQGVSLDPVELVPHL